MISEGRFIFCTWRIRENLTESSHSSQLQHILPGVHCRKEWVTTTLCNGLFAVMATLWELDYLCGWKLWRMLTECSSHWVPGWVWL